MNYRSFLAVVALVQGALLAALLVLIVLNRWLRLRRGALVHPHRIALDESMHRWALGTGEIAGVLDCLAHLPKVLAIDALTGWASRVPGERWHVLAAQLALAPWARAIRADADSARWWKRLDAGRLLAVAAVPDDTPQVLKLLRDPHPAVHLAAVGTIERLQAPEIVTAALDRLPSLTPTVYAYYASMLQRARTLVLQLLLERLTRTDTRDLARFTEFAARMQEPALRAPLTRLAAHGDAEVRVQVARALGAFPHPESIAALSQLARDAEWTIRAQAVRSLGRVGDPGSLALLRLALGDSEWWVRQRAALALQRLGGPGRNALLDAEIGANPLARDMARLVLGLSPQAIAEFAA